jgi:sugar lactone lactonase YvrE
MRGMVLVATAMAALLVLLPGSNAPAMAEDAKTVQKVTSKKVSGFVHPESVAYDPGEKVLYVSEFGSVLKPTLKDGKGRISKVSLTGEVLDKKFLPGEGVVLHKPKGVWVRGNRLWVTDIDAVWIFDLKSKKGRKIALPDAKFANDPNVFDDILYVSDSLGRRIYKVAPADFLEIKGDPKVTELVSDTPFGPNGLCPVGNGTLYVVGFEFKGPDRSVYTVDSKGKTKQISDPLGGLDGVAILDRNTLLITDWKSNSLLKWSPREGKQTLASGIAGPADFAVVPEKDGVLVVVPDLVKGDLHFVTVPNPK